MSRKIVADLRCVDCGEPLRELTLARHHGSSDFFFVHGCGVAFSEDFLRDHYGIEVGGYQFNDPAPELTIRSMKIDITDA